MAENTTLLAKLTDAEKQIKSFKADMPAKDQEIANLRKQVTETSKQLAASQAQNTQLQTELTTVQKKVDEYTKQIQQYKTDKTASVEEKRKMEEENKMLQGIVMRVLQDDANRASRRKIVQNELDRLQIQSDVLLKQIGYLTQPVVNLRPEERRLFKKPKLDVEDPNTLIIFKSESTPPPAAGTPAAPATAANPAEPPKEAEAPKTPETPTTPPPSSATPPTPPAPPAPSAEAPLPGTEKPAEAAPAKPLEMAKAPTRRRPPRPNRNFLARSRVPRMPSRM